jgi:hypothetical protein
MAQLFSQVKCLKMHLTLLDKPERSVGFSKGAPPSMGGRALSAPNPFPRALKAVTLPVGFQDVHAVRQPIQHRPGQPVTSQYLRPTLKRQVRCHNQTRSLVRPAYHLEQQLRSRLRKRHVPQFVQDQQIQSLQLLQAALQPSGFPALKQLRHKCCYRTKSHLLSLPARRKSKRTRQMRFPSPGIPHQKHILSFTQVFSSHEQLPHQRFIQRAVPEWDHTRTQMLSSGKPYIPRKPPVA